jgi:hypothetical protein
MYLFGHRLQTHSKLEITILGKVLCRSERRKECSTKERRYECARANHWFSFRIGTASGPDLIHDWNWWRLTLRRVAALFSEILGYGFFGEALRSVFDPHAPDLQSGAILAFPLI